jgi:hypothetical protein
LLFRLLLMSTSAVVTRLLLRLLSRSPFVPILLRIRRAPILGVLRLLSRSSLLLAAI